MNDRLLEPPSASESEPAPIHSDSNASPQAGAPPTVAELIRRLRVDTAALIHAEADLARWRAKSAAPHLLRSAGLFACCALAGLVAWVSGTAALYLKLEPFGRATAAAVTSLINLVVALLVGHRAKRQLQRAYRSASSDDSVDR